MSIADSFHPIPLGFPQLEEMSRYTDGSIPPPANLYSLGEKVYLACINTRIELFSQLRGSIRRRIPYAMWLDDKRDINARPDLVESYFSMIRSVEVSKNSRLKKSLTPLFHTYVIQFNPNKSKFWRLAESLQNAAIRCDKSENSTLSLGYLHRKLDFFNPGRVGENVATEFLKSGNSSDDVNSWFEKFGLWSGFHETGLGRYIFYAALRLPPETYKSESAIDSLMGWARLYDVTSLSVDQKALLATALLRPWLKHEPTEILKKKIGDFCVEILGDPRFKGFNWTQVDEAEKTLLLRWLTGRTLEIFFDVLKNTADSIWRYRQEFWTPFYRKGHITEAWVVLGPNAHRYAQRHYEGSDLIYGLLSGKSDDGQSVLLMRIGDYLFCEWSHNGKLRVAPQNEARAPKLYARYYDADDLYFRSEQFISNTGTIHEGLPHLHSEKKWWQTMAASFISRNLGIYR